MNRKISRREFAKTLAAGAALFRRQPLNTSLAQSEPSGQLLRNDLTGLSGTLLFDDAARRAAADDFGHIVHRLPIAVLRPGSAQDIMKLVQLANRRGLKVAMRGNGHAMFGQTQVDSGVVIDSSTLNSVRVVRSSSGPAIEAGPGALWGAVLDAAYAEGLTPPVNVDYVALSVGGTISTAGFGGATWREGFQVDHVLELQVVTGNGQLVTCSDERNSGLFNAVLAGVGQCGIIVKVITALRPASTHVLFFVLSYPDLQTAYADFTFLVNDGRFSHLNGRTTRQPGGGFTYNLEAGAFYNAPRAPNEAQLLAGLRFTSRTATTKTYVEYYQSVPTVPTVPAGPHPWLYLCLPASRFLEYATRVFASPAAVAFAFSRFSAWKRSGIKRPLAVVPNEDLVWFFEVLRFPPASADIASLVALNRTLYEQARDVGGTRMMPGAIPMSEADWARHYGSVWEWFRNAKQRADPNNVLGQGQGMFPG